MGCTSSKNIDAAGKGASNGAENAPITLNSASMEPRGGSGDEEEERFEAEVIDIFLAVNTSAGGLVAKQLVDMAVPRFQMKLDDGKKCWVTIFEMLDAESRENGFQSVAEVAKDPLHDVRLIACGGDGTIKWVISCLSKVNALDVPIGVIPFGTGNDMSRVLGWGSKPPNPLIGEGMNALRQRIREVYAADVIPLDVWICTVHLRDGTTTGMFEEVKRKKIQRAFENQTSISQEMINYFSIGADGELMFAFEQNRGKTQIGNKVVYARKGFVQTIAPPPRLQKYVDTCTVGHASEEEEEELKINPKDRQILFLNIPSYGAGADPWRTKGDSTRKFNFSKQFVGDHQLEVMTVRNTSNVGLNLTTGAKIGITRVKQGNSFHVTFKPNSDVYFQVDGEALKATDAKSVEVVHGYQIKLLRNKVAKAESHPEGFVPPMLTKSSILGTNSGSEEQLDGDDQEEIVERESNNQQQQQEAKQPTRFVNDEEIKASLDPAESKADIPIPATENEQQQPKEEEVEKTTEITTEQVTQQENEATEQAQAQEKEQVQVS